MTIDLHIHTSASDGNIPPNKVIQIALDKGLKTIAFADHETTAGFEAVKEYAEEKGLELIPAIELQTWHRGREVHILGYFIDVNDQAFQQKLMWLREERTRCAKSMVKKLSSFGYCIGWEEVIALNEFGGPISKGHIMTALKNRGYIKSKKDAINILDLYLNQNGKAYCSHEYSTEEAIELIRSAGGIPVLAHPGLIGNDEIVEDLVSLNIAGLEVFYYYFGSKREELITKYRIMAENKKLLMTGGSDYHGTITPVILGELKVPTQVRKDIFSYLTK